MDIKGIVLFHKIYEYNNKHRFTIAVNNSDFITVIFFDNENKFDLVRPIPVGQTVILKSCKEVSKKFGQTSKTFKAYDLEIKENENNKNY